MTKRLKMGVAAAALIVATAVAAQAADLPTRKEAPAPVFVPPPFTWTGFYVGVNAGGIWSSGSRNATLYYPAGDAFLSGYFPGGIGNNQSGFIGGAQAGYNYQTGAVVFGIETDFDGTSLGKTYNYASAPFAGAGIPGFLLGDNLYVHAKANLDWLGTTRARVGFVATPDNRLLIYGTGGIAYAGEAPPSTSMTRRRDISGAAAPARREPAGRSARALNTRSRTTSRSRANISTPTLAARTSRPPATPPFSMFWGRPSMRGPTSTTTPRSSAQASTTSSDRNDLS